MAEWEDTGAASLHGALRQSGHAVALLTTYNLNMAFLEGLVLRRLWSVGVRLVLVLADAQQVALACADPAAWPRQSGRAYALLPIQAPRAFHPKLLLLAGRHRQQVLVGSHNLTLAGYGHNREITSRLTAPEEVRAAWAFARRWAACAGLPAPEVQHLFERAEALAPVLRPVATDPPETAFVGSLPEGRSLWSQLRPRLPARAAQATLVGPYLDGEQAFLRRLHADLAPPQLTVAIDPSIGAAPERALERTRFVNAQALDLDAVGPVHAKILWVQDEAGQEWLVAGSANPSAAAFLASPEARNAEAVVLRGPEAAGSLAAPLCLADLEEAPLLGAADWHALAQRSAQIAQEPAETAPPVVLAQVTPEGLRVEHPLLGAVAISDVVLFGAGEHPLPDSPPLQQRGTGCLIRLEAPVGVRLAELHLEDGRLLRALVYDGLALAARARTDQQQALHTALQTIGAAGAELEGLLRLVEKVIFDEEVALRPPRPRPGPDRAPAEVSSSAPAPERLSVVRSAEHSLPRPSALAEGDLLLVLGTLSARLGVGLAPSAPGGPLDEAAPEELLARSEEVDPELDADVEEAAAPDPEAEERLAQACGQRLRTLTSRLQRQLAQAREADTDAAALQACTQVAAVLAIFWQLAALDVQRSPAPRLASKGSLLALFEVVLGGFFCGPRALAGRAAALHGEEGCEELSMARGLLAWMALAASHPEDGADRHLAIRILVFSAVQADVRAARIGEQALRTAPLPRMPVGAAGVWTAQLQRAALLAQISTAPAQVPVERRTVEPGDLVFAARLPVPVPLVVARRENDKLGALHLATRGWTELVFKTAALSVVRRGWP